MPDKNMEFSNEFKIGVNWLKLAYSKAFPNDDLLTAIEPEDLTKEQFSQLMTWVNSVFEVAEHEKQIKNKESK